MFLLVPAQWSNRRVSALRMVDCWVDPGWVTPMTVKMVLIASLLGTQYSTLEFGG